MTASEDQLALFATVEKGVEKHGVYLLSVKKAGINYQSLSVPCMSKVMTERMDEAFIYSIGHRALGRPEILAWCGPKIGTKSIDAETLRLKLIHTSVTINRLIKNWEADPILPGDRVHCGDGRIYMVTEGTKSAFLKDKFTTQVGKYYGDNNYELLVLIPT